MAAGRWMRGVSRASDPLRTGQLDGTALSLRVGELESWAPVPSTDEARLVLAI